MSKLRNRFERFCYNHRTWGIPNLMLYVTLGSAIVYLMSIPGGSGAEFYYNLCFNKELILQGQVWRLITHVFTYAIAYNSNAFFVLISLYCYYSLGRLIEHHWGTFRFNLFYFSGVILMDAFAMIFSTRYYAPVYLDMAYYLNLSLVLAFSTMYPEAQFTILFVIPVKARILCVLDLVLTGMSVFTLSYPELHFPHNLFPLVALLNYFLFFGKDVLNLLPPSWRIRRHKKPQKTAQAAPAAKVIQFRTEKVAYNHRCTICGRTDVSDPQLEFRYCSRCNGYHCYCQDHINNHEHVQS